MKKRSILAVLFIIGLLLIVWVMSEKAESYPEPTEALFAVDDELLLIPGYKGNGKALYFFIKNKNHLGATYTREGLFGWKVGMRTWSPMDFDRNYDTFAGYQGHGENLIYGLIKHGDKRQINIGDEHARILNLEMLPPAEVEKYRLEDLYIWYFESDKPFDGLELELINSDNGEELDSIRL